MRKSQQEVNTMVKHYETHRKTNVLQHVGGFDVDFLRWECGVSQIVVIIPKGGNSYGTPLSVATHQGVI